MLGPKFKARLVIDIVFLDFTGKRFKQKAGTVVDVFRRNNSEYVCTDADGQPVLKPDGSFVAVHGKFHFAVPSYAFQAFN